MNSVLRSFKKFSKLYITFTPYSLLVTPLEMTIKKKCQPLVRLPVLNWMAMKPNQVRGTVFADLDDEKLYSVSFQITIFNSILLLCFRSLSKMIYIHELCFIDYRFHFI